jgi:Na+-translocating ferredoxin:NAD+ oxidoreductase RnfG subunit
MRVLLIVLLVKSIVYGYMETVYSTQDEAFQQVFPLHQVDSRRIPISAEQREAMESTLHMAIPNDEITVYTFHKEDTLQGYGVVTNELGKHEPITFFVAFTSDLFVKGIVVMTYREPYGDEVRKKRFLKQFRQLRVTDPIRVYQDITPVSGATVSAIAIANGVRRLLVTLHTLL